ncbi:HpcH/HpaI aldolase/citrate lyase family protein [Actinomadura sp. HBU206391]|uniref:HpcH/HpaI aldolase/citrate lyase family protein n=1 Tax=Actinomadura sp. HBU206391 TaxID=2731692 RepID=UPI00164F329F|nr:CoA ester lyase [Actinomadura sp. HBU206391]MBC6462582.1 CoA ester lyase [Actinomadura sp. HBU206391]
MSVLPGPALLFCPADRPDRYAKALAAADTVILDLEDAVAPPERAAARQALLVTPVDPGRVIVRVNAVGTDDHELDLRAVRQTAYRRIMVAKTESAADLDELAEWQIVALCETARGVVRAAEIAAVPSVVALMWGAEDLVASLGGYASRYPDGRYRDIARAARAQVLFAAGAHGRAAIDAVYLDIDDLAGLAAETEDAVASGFACKACIHPGQVETVRVGFAPSPDRVAWARRVLAAGAERGVVRVDGQMVDAPLLAQAQRVLAIARRQDT